MARRLAFLVNAVLPCILYEDQHLLVVNKPAGINTHAPSQFAGEGVYDWLRHREARWASLAIVQRLDKDTSGVLVFANSPLANRSLTDQFTKRAISKTYVFVTDRTCAAKTFCAKSRIVRVGPKYVNYPLTASGEYAETRFEVVGPDKHGARIKAYPITGRTHQIRVHAAAHGVPVLGDSLYGGTPANRLFLHAEQIILSHPETGVTMQFNAPPDFEAHPGLALRTLLIDAELTDAFRIIHGAADSWPGWYVDRLGDFLLSQSERLLTDGQQDKLAELLRLFSLRGVYHQITTRFARQTDPGQLNPQQLMRDPAPAEFIVRENSVQFALSFSEGYSVGLFLDQRDNRRRLLTNHVAKDFPVSASGMAGAEVLNTFAYTCGFSVCAAKAGACVTSLDLSRKYLAWGQRNFSLNGLDPSNHDFLFGDVFDWLRRLAKKNRSYDVIILDPPTFSTSKSRGPFRAEQDYGKLVRDSLPLLKPNGILFASTNAAGLSAEKFLAVITDAIKRAGRSISSQHYAPQPPDFPITRSEPACLKTIWLRL